MLRNRRVVTFVLVWFAVNFLTALVARPLGITDAASRGRLIWAVSWPVSFSSRFSMEAGRIAGRLETGAVPPDHLPCGCGRDGRNARTGARGLS
jgi:hypothetical protein